MLFSTLIIFIVTFALFINYDASIFAFPQHHLLFIKGKLGKLKHTLAAAAPTTTMSVELIAAAFDCPLSGVVLQLPEKSLHLLLSCGDS